MAKHLFILNNPPYGTERSYNAVRLARTLLNAQEEVRVFLMGDAAACAVAGQKVPQGYYNLGDMLGSVLRRNGEISVCGTCMDARGIAEDRLIEGARRGERGDRLSRHRREAARQSARTRCGGHGRRGFPLHAYAGRHRGRGGRSVSFKVGAGETAIETCLPCEALILAFGQQPAAPHWLKAGGVATQYGAIKVDAHGRTSHPRVFAGGDAVHGADLIITAAGRRVVRAVARHRKDR